jgi:hypothetical protein
MHQPYNDLKPPEMVERLKVFLEEMELVEQEPCFGHYIPTLNFSPWEIPQKPTFRPDNHYFQAAGQEPPQEPPTARTLRNVCCWVMAWIIVGELILLLWPVLV